MRWERLFHYVSQGTLETEADVLHQSHGKSRQRSMRTDIWKPSSVYPRSVLSDFVGTLTAHAGIATRDSTKVEDLPECGVGPNSSSTSERKLTVAGYFSNIAFHQALQLVAVEVPLIANVHAAVRLYRKVLGLAIWRIVGGMICRASCRIFHTR